MILNHLEILEENLKALNESSKWLMRSYTICSQFLELSDQSDMAIDAYEGLTSRFARTTDILFNKVFRSIIYIEEGESKSWIDVLIYMEKKMVIDSLENARLIKELTNDIVHEYLISDLSELIKEIINYCPLLFSYIEKTIELSNTIKNKIQR